MAGGGAHFGTPRSCGAAANARAAGEHARATEGTFAAGRREDQQTIVMLNLQNAHLRLEVRQYSRRVLALEEECKSFTARCESALRMNAMVPSFTASVPAGTPACTPPPMTPAGTAGFDTWRTDMMSATKLFQQQFTDDLASQQRRSRLQDGSPMYNTSFSGYTPMREAQRAA